jgi:hypothetical protein
MARFVAIVSGAAITISAATVQADQSNFVSTTNDLGGGAHQLVDTFDILYSGANAYLDFNLDNVPDVAIPVGAPDTLGAYLDPQHYVLEFGTNLSPYFLGSELAAAASVDWRLSYTSTPGSTNIYSTIMSGIVTDNSGSVWNLDIAGGFEWPVSGVPANDFGIPEGTHVAALIADFNSFSWDSESGVISANVIPAPGAMALLALGGLSSRRRRN